LAEKNTAPKKYSFRNFEDLFHGLNVGLEKDCFVAKSILQTKMIFWVPGNDVYHPVFFWQ